MQQYPCAYRTGSARYQTGPGVQLAPSGPSDTGAGTVEQPPQWDLYRRVIQQLASEGSKLGELLEEATRPPSGGGSVPPSGPPKQVGSSPLPGVSAGAYRAAALRSAKIAPLVNYALLARDLVELARSIYDRMKVFNLTPLSGGADCFAPCGLAHEVRWLNNTTCTLFSCVFGEVPPKQGLARPTPSSRMGLYMRDNPVTKRYDIVRIYIWPTTLPDPLPLPAFDLPEELPIVWPWLPELLPITQPVADPQPMPFRVRPARPASPYYDAGYEAPDRSVVMLSDLYGFATSPNDLPSTRGLPNPLPGGPPMFPPVSVNHAPPGEGTKDKKYRGAKAMAIWMALGAATEVDEMLECAWKALPKNKRKRILGKKLGGQTIYWWNPKWAKKHGYTTEQIKAHNDKVKVARPVHQTPQNMLDDLSKGFESLDRKKFEDCFLENAVVDAAFGIPSVIAVKNFREFQQKALGSTSWMHIGTGPAL